MWAVAGVGVSCTAHAGPPGISPTQNGTSFFRPFRKPRRTCSFGSASFFARAFQSSGLLLRPDLRTLSILCQIIVNTLPEVKVCSRIVWLLRTGEAKFQANHLRLVWRRFTGRQCGSPSRITISSRLSPDKSSKQPTPSPRNVTWLLCFAWGVCGL